MNHEPESLTRREILRRAVAASVGLAALPAAAKAPEEFVPENDYPFFGHEPQAETSHSLGA